MHGNLPQFKIDMNKIQSTATYLALNSFIKYSRQSGYFRKTLISYILQDCIACYIFIEKCNPYPNEKLAALWKISEEPECARIYFENFNPTDPNEREILIEAAIKNDSSIKLMKNAFTNLTIEERKKVFGKVSAYSLRFIKDIIYKVPLTYEEQIIMTQKVIKEQNVEIGKFLMNNTKYKDIEEQLLSFITIYKLTR